MKLLEKVILMKRIKHVRQLEEQDCGPACVAMIIKSYKSNISIETLKVLANTTTTGTSAFGLKECFEKLKFNCNVLKTSHLPENNDFYPLIAHVLIDDVLLHYLVIHSVKKNIVTISDPSENKVKKIKLSEFQKIWTGILIIAEPSSDYQITKEKNTSLLSHINFFIYKKNIILKIILLSIILLLIGMGMAFYYQVIIDYLIPEKKITALSIISISLICVYIFQIILGYARTNLLIKVSLSINYELMKSYVKHILFLPMSFFYNRKTGDIISRFLDVSKIVEALSELILIIFIDLLLLIGMGFILFRQSIYLFWISLATIPIYAIIIYIFYKPLEQKKQKEIIEDSKLNSIIIESLQGIETIKVYNNENYMTEKISKSIQSMMKSSLNLAKLDSLQEEFKSFLDITSSLLILWWGSAAVMSGQLTIGQMISFNSLLIYFTNPLKNIINLQSKLQTAKIANERLSNVMNLETEKNKKNHGKLIEVKGDLEFKNISYGYLGSDHTINNINFKVNAGESLAVVGESGSGKSTIARMIVKFLIPNNGVISIDNQPITNIDVTEIRNICTYVSQDSFFFTGTIKDNLLFGNDKEITQSEIDSNCIKADIFEFINKLPYKFETILDEGATNLSSGQKQRLAIARSLIKDNKIIIFDEATSSLDAITEKNIIKKLMLEKTRTLIFISHRLYVSKMCQSIIVVEDGTIVEQGTHDALLKNKEKYFNLYYPDR